MAYNQNIPQATDKLKDSQPQLLANFQAIKTLVDVNHVTFDAPSGDQGKHNKISMPLNPGATFLLNEMGLFNQNVAPFNRPDIWMARGNTTAFPITGYHNVNIGSTDGWTYLPSGLKIIWGTSTIVAGGQLVVTYAAADPTFPGFTTFWTCPQLTRIDNSGGSVTNFVAIRTFSSIQFTAKSSLGGNNVEFAWMVIGL